MSTMRQSFSRKHLTPMLFALIFFSFGTTAFAQTGQLRVNLTQNDRVEGGTLLVNIETKVTGISPSTLGSATIDLDYDDADLTFVSITASDINPAVDGYSLSASDLSGDPVSGNGSGAYVRLTITGNNVGPDFGMGTGFDVPTAYANLATYQFTVTAAGAAAGSTDLFVRTGSLSIGYFENQSNNPKTGVIEEATIDLIEDANSIPLPVELADFRAALDAGAVVLTWTTLSEWNNAGFEVESVPKVSKGEQEADAASTDDWATLGFVPGAGSTSDEQQYVYRAADLEVGTYRFRLRQVDLSGVATYSDEVEATVEVPGDYLMSEVYPNPFNPIGRFTLAVRIEQEVSVDLFDALGRHVATLRRGPMSANETHRMVIDGGQLASGLYIVKVVGERFASVKPILLLK